MKKYTVDEFLAIAELDERSNIYFVEADDGDVTITVNGGCCNFGMRGEKSGSITIDGIGHCSVWRYGAGKGDACILGSLEGSAFRDGPGDGSAYRFGSGGGSAYRDGQGDGSAYRYDTGRGNASRDGAGAGSAYRNGPGTGSAFRYGIEIKSGDMKMEKCINKNSSERAAYGATCTTWVTENTPLREELAYRDGHRAGWENAIKEVGKLIDNVK